MHLFLDHIFTMLCMWHYLWELKVYGAVLLMQPLHIHSAACVLILSFENKLSSSLQLSAWLIAAHIPLRPAKQFSAALQVTAWLTSRRRWLIGISTPNGHWFCFSLLAGYMKTVKHLNYLPLPCSGKSKEAESDIGQMFNFYSELFSFR